MKIIKIILIKMQVIISYLNFILTYIIIFKIILQSILT